MDTAVEGGTVLVEVVVGVDRGTETTMVPDPVDPVDLEGQVVREVTARPAPVVMPAAGPARPTDDLNDPARATAHEGVPRAVSVAVAVSAGVPGGLAVIRVLVPHLARAAPCAGGGIRASRAVLLPRRNQRGGIGACRWIRGAGAGARPDDEGAIRRATVGVRGSDEVPKVLDVMVGNCIKPRVENICNMHVPCIMADNCSLASLAYWARAIAAA